MSNFAEIVQILRIANRLELVKVLAKHAVTSLVALRSLNAHELVAWCLEANIPSDTIEAAIKWQQGRTLAQKSGQILESQIQVCSEPKRKDLPVVRPVSVSKRPKIQIALEVARNASLYKTEQDKFTKDQWAASSLGPKESVWHTWCELATAGNFDPLPVTQELVLHMGVLFKAAEYSSAQNYFNEATSRHLIETGFPVSVLVRKTIKASMRSIRRGLANATQKRAIMIEFVPARNAWTCESDLPALPETWSFSQKDSTVDPLALCISGSWFLCREIELAAAKVRDISINSDLRTVSWNLPSSKTDSAATGVVRTHGCSCNGDTTTFNHLCPFHCLLQHRSNLRSFFSDLTNESFLNLALFPTKAGNVMDKDSTVQAIRFCAQLTGADPTYTDARGRLRQSFGGHALRASGAQFLARHGVDTYLIQLIGRWGSNAILRYIQQAPLALQHRLASSLAHNPNVMAGPLAIEPAQHLSEAQIRAVLQDTIDEIRKDLETVQILATQEKELFIINLNTQFVHRPDPFETNLPTAEWKAKGCKWRYGQLSHKRVSVLPDGPLLCPGCFGFRRTGTRTKQVPAQAAPVQPLISSDSDSKESQSESDHSDESDS